MRIRAWMWKFSAIESRVFEYLENRRVLTVNSRYLEGQMHILSQRSPFQINNLKTRHQINPRVPRYFVPIILL